MTKRNRELVCVPVSENTNIYVTNTANTSLSKEERADIILKLMETGMISIPTKVDIYVGPVTIRKTFVTKLPIGTVYKNPPRIMKPLEEQGN